MRLWLLVLLLPLPLHAQWESHQKNTLTFNVGIPSHTEIHDPNGSMVVIRVMPDKASLARLEALSACALTVSKARTLVTDIIKVERNPAMLLRLNEMASDLQATEATLQAVPSVP